MTIQRGEPWGAPAIVPDDFIAIPSNQALHEALAIGVPDRPLCITGSDLARTLGVRSGSLVAGEPATEVSLDLIRVVSRDRVGWAAGHVVVRGSWWRGTIQAAMNGQFIGPWDVAPRSHPNDGRFDLVTVDSRMSAAERWKARSRLHNGTYLPHPMITARQLKVTHIDVPMRASVYLDGARWASHARQLDLSIVPDALVVFLPLS